MDHERYDDVPPKTIADVAKKAIEGYDGKHRRDGYEMVIVPDGWRANGSPRSRDSLFQGPSPFADRLDEYFGIDGWGYVTTTPDGDPHPTAQVYVNPSAYDSGE